ncbi:hypothetical protein HF086_013925 [Spodoptera exigua]|uniref:Myosin motor domain-containing protein n=1 Tax=Spodoptera exigua TaxID=7107 RepID=A0A922MI10_SPOEX|nr:hypothetical protein HF086_013925 [Spodoptera exigua]
MADAEGVGQPDAVLLAPLSEDTFLHNLHVRYKRDIIYVSIGAPAAAASRRPAPPDAARVADVRGQRAGVAEPVPPAAAVLGGPGACLPGAPALPAAAPPVSRPALAPPAPCPPHFPLTLSLLAGESGAGKTEAARVCLQCAVLAGAGPGPAAGPAAGPAPRPAPGPAPGPALAAAGTLLEAFGNAATSRNHNASRFVTTTPRTSTDRCILHYFY